MANINLNNVSKMEDELRLAHSDLIAFGKLFLPDDFMRSETPFFHYEVADALMNKDYRQLGIILPRGHGKTVLTKCKVTTTVTIEFQMTHRCRHVLNPV